jgi:hypothetical protein
MTTDRHRPRRARFLVPVFLVALLAPAPARGQADSPPTIEQVRVGLPTGQGGQEATYSRNAAWAPVYVKLKAGKDGNPQGRYQLVVETTDGEDLPYRYTSAVPALPANDEHTVITYTRPGTDGSEFTVSLQTSDSRVLQTNPRFVRTGRQMIGPRDQLILSLGSRLSGLRRALQPAQPDQPEPADNDLEDRGQRHTAFFDDVAQMPDRWFGYDAVDVVVFTTGRKELLDQLLTETGTARFNALAEWVRRGGKLIVSVGSNHQQVARLFERVPLLDCKVVGSNTVAELFPARTWAGNRLRAETAAPRKVEVALLEPGAGTLVLLAGEGGAGGKKRPLIIQGAFGLGMVSYVAFDLDTPPMTTWEGQTAFWQRCLDELAPPLPESNARPNPGMPNQPQFGLFGDRPELATELQRALDDFGTDIPTIPFYWVALFILFYILLVGPIDYFLLKKVFKRLELTWVTFPAAVILISVAAYLIAYSVKGDDRRVNKVDLVEIDLNEPRQVYGTSWWTLFSPRIQNYTLGVEPAPEWAGPPAGNPVPGSTVVEVMDRPDEGGRKGSQGLFRRPYDYAEDASGLENVPIPVWATRSFTASWRAPLPGGKSPVEVTVIRPRGKEERGDLTVRVVNHLPVALQGLTLFYRNRWYDGRSLEPEEPATILLGDEGKPKRLNDWFADRGLQPAPLPGQSLPSRVTESKLPNYLLKPILFYRDSGSPWLNSGLRTFDQSWRMRERVENVPREEIILVARTPYQTGKADEVDRASAAPTRLWLDEVPGPGRQRPDLRGYLTQETFLRIYVPVR